MPEIRPARDDELDRVHLVVAYSFTGDRSQEGRERMRHVEELAAPLVLIENGEIVASLRVYDLTMLVNGAPVRMGGVSSVACLPEYRRMGYVGMLLRHSLEQMREAGQPLSALYTPHPSLYRRYGWMVAGSLVKTTFNPKEVAPRVKTPPPGRAVRVSEEDQPVVEQIFRRFCERRTGPLVRSDRWWKEAFFRRIYDTDRKVADVAVWYSATGDPEGYACYESSRGPAPEGASRLWLREFVALGGDAYLGLLRYVLSHDLMEEVMWFSTVDEPLSAVLEDSDHRILKREYGDGFMLRVVDVEKAVAARPPGTGAPGGSFTVSISDAAAPWNQGIWRIESSGGKLSARKADGAGADLSMEAATFAAVYDGFMRASDAVRSGLAEGSDLKAALLADRMFAAEYPPNGSDFF
jgi:predicted acetyltransferase